jgi:hypothetical protein
LNAIESLELLPGSVGAFIDDVPMLTSAHIRPFVVAILLHRGAVRHHEVIACLVPHCSNDEMKVGGWDPLDNEYCEGTRAEKLVDEVLGEFVSEGIVRYSEDQDIWVLTTKDIPRIISWVTSLGARMPQHLLSEISKQPVSKFSINKSIVDIPWDGSDIEPVYPSRKIRRNIDSSSDDCNT